MRKSWFGSWGFLLFFGLTGLCAAQDQSTQYYQAGNTFYAQKNYDQATRYYDAAIQINPNQWQAYQGLGNCHYAKGDKTGSLSYYQKSLSLHRDNPALASFVQSLRTAIAQAQTPADSQYSKTEKEKILRTAAGISDAHFEINPSIGAALELDGAGSGLGFGLGCGGFYMFDSQFGIGGLVHLYVFGSSYSSTSSYTTDSFTQGTETTTTTESVSSLEIVPSLKYKFEGKTFRPYLITGLGLTLLSAKSSTSYNYQNGAPYYGSSLNYAGSGSTIDPIVEGGGGLEFNLDREMSLFVEARFDVVLGGYGTATYLPIEGGLNFDL